MRVGQRRAAVAGAFALLTGCAAEQPAAPPATSPTDSRTARPAPHAQRGQQVVVLVSIDGLNPDVLDDTDLPAFDRLAAEGASTLNARTLVESTETLPNHAAMLTGRPVDGFSVLFNADDGSTLAQVHGAYVPGVFDVAHDRGVATALLAEKDKFGFLIRSWDAEHGAADEVGADNGRDKVDIEAVAEADEVLGRALDALDDGVRLLFVHLKGPDSAGHEHGWLSGEYVDAVRAADARIGKLLESVDDDPDLRWHTTVIVTADHGGSPGAQRHADPGVLADYRVPFFAWGNAVRKGADLYGLNRTRRRDPGTAQPGYDGPQPIRNLDAANLALRLLRLPALDDGLDTRPLRLR